MPNHERATHVLPLVTRVSVVIPAYNGEAFVADAIESVLAQTLPASEIVVVDDGSSDGTLSVAQRYASKGVRCIQQRNQGPSAARNAGIAATTGELIGFLDCDDIWLPQKTALQAEYLAASPDVGLVAAHAWFWDPRTNRRWLERMDAGRKYEILIRNCIGTPSGVMVRRRALEDVGGFDLAHSHIADWELWARIQSRWQVGIVDQPLFVYRIVPTSLTFQNVSEHASQTFELSRQLIRKYAPPISRPRLWLRAWSIREHSRAVTNIGRFPHYLWHACRALVSYPFADGKAKLKHFIRALIGEALYRPFKARAARETEDAELYQLGLPPELHGALGERRELSRQPAPATS